jgi:hypothetical protein
MHRSHRWRKCRREGRSEGFKIGIRADLMILDTTWMRGGLAGEVVQEIPFTSGGV